jgi:hypothetical protein
VMQLENGFQCFDTHNPLESLFKWLEELIISQTQVTQLLLINYPGHNPHRFWSTCREGSFTCFLCTKKENRMSWLASLTFQVIPWITVRKSTPGRHKILSRPNKDILHQPAGKIWPCPRKIPKFQRCIFIIAQLSWIRSITWCRYAK